MSTEHPTTGSDAEQIQLAREIGSALSDAFVAYVRGHVTFEDLTFGAHDALHDLYVVRSGDYELVDEDDDGHDHEHRHHHDHDKPLTEQEDLAQEPSRDEGA